MQAIEEAEILQKETIATLSKLLLKLSQTFRPKILVV